MSDDDGRKSWKNAGSPSAQPPSRTGAGAGGVHQVVQGMEDMVLEEGRLEDTTLNVAPDSTQAYYTLNAVDPTEREAVSPTAYSHIRPNYLHLGQQQAQSKQEVAQLDNIRFSPEGNEGFLLTTCAVESEDRTEAQLSSSNTPREVDEQFLQRYNYSSSKYKDRVDGQVLRNSVIQRSTNHHPRVDQTVASTIKSAVGSLRMTPRDFVAADLQYDESVQSASPRSAGYLTDRATSPSAASVTSLQSVSSQASVTGRRLLEWDYGSDIGYVDGLQTQVQAAQSLSTLEKLAIGNYSDILTRQSEEQVEFTGGRNRLALDDQDAMDVDAKMKTFAQSLIRQRELSHQQVRQRRKSSSPKRNTTNKELPNDANPVIKTRIANNQQSALSVEKSKLHPKKLRRSSSLSEISKVVITESSDTQDVIRSASNNQINNPTLISPEQGTTSQEAATSNNGSELAANDGKASLSVGPNVEDQLSKLSRASRQSSKRSMSTSYETVIAADPSASSGKESFDTEDENRGVEDEVQLQVAMHKWNRQDNSRVQAVSERLHDDQYIATRSRNRELLLNSRPEPIDFNPENIPLPTHFSINGNLRRTSRPLHHISGNSSVPSTSDEESGRRRILERMALRLDQRETGGDTSTLDSVQMIDRAKSFEYIPGESFPIQENSSSYEYLPGHLVPEQRPPTVLNLGPGEDALIDPTLAGPSGSQRTRSESVPSSSRSFANQNSNTTEIMNDQGLDQLAKDLKGKSKELYAKNVSMTKHFYKKLRRYLDFLATPSNSVAECRIKQQLAVKISKMLSSEQARLDQSSEAEQSSQHEGTSVSHRPHSSTEGSTASPPAKPDSPTLRHPHLGQDKSKGALDSDFTSPNTTERKNWRSGKTKSEERFARKKVEVPNVGSIQQVQSLNTRRAEHLKILKRELKILERLEREEKKENAIAKSMKSSSGCHTKSSNSSELPTPASPTRKLSHTKRSRAMEDVSKTDDVTRTRDSTTITDFALSKDNSEKKDELKMLSESEGHRTLSSDELRRKKDQQQRKELRKGGAGSRHVERGTQMTQTDLSSVLSQSENEMRKSVKKKSGSKEHSARTESVKFHTRFEAHSTEESLRAMPSSPEVLSYSSETSYTNHRQQRFESRQDSSETTPTVCSSVDTTEQIFIRRTRHHWNKENLPKRKTAKEKRDKTICHKPVAYFLPMDNLNPIRIGKKILKDSHPNEHGFHSFKHRNILTKYISSVDHHAQQTHNKHDDHEQAGGVVPQCTHAKLSLQEALLRKHPHFVHRCEYRMQVLRQIRDEREERAERHTAWLEKLRDMSPNSRRNTVPCYSPVPTAPRLFTHREMVEATKNKYLELPEVQNKKYLCRRQGSYATNRLRREVYTRQLNRRIKRGQISLTHHARVF